MTLSIAEREKRIIEIERKICRQQQILVKLVRELSHGQCAVHPQIPTIGQVIDRYMTKIGRDAEESIRKYRAISRYITTIGLGFKNKYSELHNEKALLRVMQAVIARTDIHGDQKMRHVRWINELVRFATCAYPDMFKTNVLIGMPTIKRTPKSARRPHTPYSDIQLKRIFDPQHRFFHKYPDMFWGCMIALFTGSRKNAVFTLQYKDIIQREGIWCFNFIEDCPGIKMLKTEDSQRLVPIHSELIKMGFLDFVHGNSHAVPTDFIFKRTCLTAKGTLDTHMTRKLFVFLKQIGIRDAGMGRYDFHSFRKNANITMEKCGLLRSYIDKIIGWQSRGSEGERSYSNYTIKQVADHLELLHYDCLKPEFKHWKKIMAKH